MMDIRHLRTFVTVAKLGSLTRAAEALHVTQPAISGHLKLLEGELGLSLLSRTTASLTLTQVGRELIPRDEKAIESFGDFVNAAKSNRGHPNGKVSLGVPLLETEVLRIGPFVRQIADKFSDLHIELSVGRTVWLLDALRSAELDATLLVCKQIPAGFEGIELQSQRYLIAGPPSWSESLLTNRSGDVGKLPWIGSPPGAAHKIKC